MYYNIWLSCLKLTLEFLNTIFYLFYQYFFFINSNEENVNDVVFFCGYGNIPGEKEKWDGDTKYMGGSENSLILLAEKLSKKYNVKIYNNCKYNKIINNVEYINSNKFNYYNKYGVVIFWRFSFPLLFCNIRSSNKILWIHDGEPLINCLHYLKRINILSKIIQKMIQKIDNIICPSYFLKEKMNEYINLDYKYTTIIPNFVKKNNKIITNKKKNKILWHVNFNRGLKTIIDNWNKIKLLNKDFELHIYGDKKELYINSKDYDNILNDDIFFHNKINHNEMVDIIPEYDFFIYPAIIRESFSISTWECLINNCLPIVYNLGAIKEIENYGGVVVKENNFDEILLFLKFFLVDDNYEKQLIKINKIDKSFIHQDNIYNQWLNIIK